MGTIDQSRVTSGYDVEALIGAGYVRMILQTAFDAGLLPSSEVFGGTRVRLATRDDGRLYPPEPDELGELPPTHSFAFETELFFEHPQGFDLMVRLMIVPEGSFTVPFDLFLQVGMNATPGDGSLESASFVIHVADIDSPILPLLADAPFNLSKSEVVAKVQAAVDREIDLGSASKFKRIEDIAFKFHPGDAEHDPALGLYLNLRLRNGDEEDAFLPARGDVNAAQNFLPTGDDVAFASRPGLYGDVGKDVFSRTALRKAGGQFEHALRKNLLNPNSTRIGDVHSIKVRRLTVPGPSGPMPVNGLLLTLKGEYVDPKDLTKTDVTFSMSVRPKLDGDGFLEWDSDIDVDVDLLFEFMTFWAATLGFILFGPVGAGVVLGTAVVGQVGAGIFLGEYFEARARKKADATLTDVIPDRLTIKTGRWDPFYATLHQVVTKPSQVEFDDQGFLLTGKAFVGRELVPPLDTVIRDETRSAAGEIETLRYLIRDADKVAADSLLHPPGAHRRSFTPPDPAEPELYPLTLDEFHARVEDPEGPLVLQRIPYFPVCVYVRGHQIDQLLCLAASELEDVRDELRNEVAARHFGEIEADRGDDIRQAALDDLSAGGEPPTEEEVEGEFQKRMRQLVKDAMADYESPTPLQMTHSGLLHDRVRFDAAPEDLLMLQDEGIIVIDGALASVEPRAISRHLRDIPFRGEEEEKDNLLERPRYRPGPNGPQFD
jgi:hypothetical protein